MEEAARAFLGAPLTTHCLQEADVLPERADAAAEGEQEHEDAHHNQQDGRVHGQAGQRCFWGRGLPLSLSLVPTEGGTREGVGCPQNCPLPLVGDSPVWLGEGYRKQYCPPMGRTQRAQKGLWCLI